MVKKLEKFLIGASIVANLTCIYVVSDVLSNEGNNFKKGLQYFGNKVSQIANSLPQRREIDRYKDGLTIMEGFAEAADAVAYSKDVKYWQ